LNDGISIVQTAEGAISAASEMAQRMLTLAVQGSNGGLSQSSRQTIKSELASLISGINNIAIRTKVGDNTLLNINGTATSASNKMSVYSGNVSTDVVNLDQTAFYNIGSSFAVANSAVSTGSSSIALSVNAPSTYSAGTIIYKLSNGQVSSIGTVSGGAGTATLSINRVDNSWSLVEGDVLITNGSERGLLATTTTGTSGKSLVENVYRSDLVSTSDTVAQAAFLSLATEVSQYLTSLNTQRGKLGAYQNQMEYSVNNIQELSANLSTARSRVQDTDYATETAKLTKGQILQQAATAMLAQANQMPNVILSLLK
jgi:flagellin